MFLNECNKCSFRVESGLFEFATTLYLRFPYLEEKKNE